MWRRVVVAVAFVGLIVVGAIAVSQRGDDSTRLATGGSSTTSTSSSTTSTTSTSSTTTLPTAPDPTSAPITTAPPEASPPAEDPKVHDADYGPPSPSVTTYPYEPGRTSWTGSDGTMTFTIRVLTANPVAGQPVEVEFTATDPAGCCGFYIWYGDGQGDSDSRGCPVSTASDSATLRFTHTWTESGRWKILAGARNQFPSCTEGQVDHHPDVIAWVDIG